MIVEDNFLKNVIQLHNLTYLNPHIFINENEIEYTWRCGKNELHLCYEIEDNKILDYLIKIWGIKIDSEMDIIDFSIKNFIDSYKWMLEGKKMNRIKIIGESIYFDNQKVADIIIPNGTLREKFEDTLNYQYDSYTVDYESGYDEGYDDGFRHGQQM